MWVVILLIVVIYFYRKNRKNDKIYRVWDTYESRYSVCQDFELDQKKYTRSSTTQRGPITYVNENGYLCFISSDYPVHRWLAAKKIGRKLKKGQVVHHMDRNKLNRELSIANSTLDFKFAAFILKDYKQKKEELKGDSFENPIILNSNLTIFSFVPEIYKFIEKEFGQLEKDWFLEKQESIRKNGKRYDVMHIKLKNGIQIKRYFDKTNIGSLNDLLK